MLYIWSCYDKYVYEKKNVSIIWKRKCAYYIEKKEGLLSGDKELYQMSAKGIAPIFLISFLFAKYIKREMSQLSVKGK